MAHRISERAELDLDEIWLYIARESGELRTADRVIETITSRFLLLARSPFIGRSRERDFGPGFRSSAVGDYVIVYCLDGEDVQILRVVHGRRDLERLFGPS